MNIAFFPTPQVIAQIGPIELHFYGAMYALAGVCAYFLLMYLGKKRNVGWEKETVMDFIFWAFLSGVLGGRLFYVVVYNWEYFSHNLSDIFAVWKGGMSIHGGLLGGSLGALLFLKLKNISAEKIAGIVTPALALGMMFGRIGNFVNGELCGRVTDVWWGIECDGEVTHPSQLYAAFKDMVLFVVFFWIVVKTQISGWRIFGSFLMSYSVLRFFVEFFREPDVQVGFVFAGFSLGQVLSVVLFLIGIFMLFFRKNINSKT